MGDVSQASGSVHEARWYLRKEEIKQALSADAVAMLYAHSQRQMLAKGEIFWFDDVDKPQVYLVDTGMAGLCKTDDDGKKFYLQVLAPGELFGQLVPDVALPVVEDYLEVIRDCRLITIDGEAFYTVLKTHPEFAFRLVRILGNRTTLFQRRLAGMLLKEAKSRLAEFLLELEEKFGQVDLERPELPAQISLTHQEIAEIVGVSRPVASAIISDFIKQGLVDKAGRNLLLTAPEELKAIAEGEG